MFQSRSLPAAYRQFGPLLAAIAGLVQTAAGHEVWIEDTPEGNLVVRFAEYGEKFAVSPGALDALTLPFAWTPAAGAEVKALPRLSLLTDKKMGGSLKASSFGTQVFTTEHLWPESPKGVGR